MDLKKKAKKLKVRSFTQEQYARDKNGTARAAAVPGKWRDKWRREATAEAKQRASVQRAGDKAPGGARWVKEKKATNNKAKVPYSIRKKYKQKGKKTYAY